MDSILRALLPAASVEDRLDNIGDGGLAGVGFGYAPTTWLRSELMVDFRAGLRLNAKDQGFPQSTSFHATINSTSFMLNSYLVAPVPGTARVKVLAGFGFGANLLDISTVSYTDNTLPPSNGSVPGGNRANFAWQAAGGVDYLLNETITLSALYRYYDGGRLSTGGSGGFDSVAGAFNYPGMHGRLTSNEVVAAIKLGF